MKTNRATKGYLKLRDMLRRYGVLHIVNGDSYHLNRMAVLIRMGYAVEDDGVYRATEKAGTVIRPDFTSLAAKITAQRANAA